MSKIAVIGFGLNGLATAYGLLERGFDVSIFGEKKFLLETVSYVNRDTRTSFLSHKTISFFSSIANEIIDQSGFIKYIYSYKNSVNAVVELLDENLGYVVDNSRIKDVLSKKILSYQNVTIIENTQISDIQNEKHCVIINGQSFDMAIVCSGANSIIHKALKREQSVYSYNQTAYVFDVEHEKPHKHIATESFGDDHVLALLPKYNQHKSSIILSVANSIKINNEDMLHFIKSQSQRARHIGDITSISTDISSYPLSTKYMKIQHSRSVVFIGDAFHCIHPVLGQGFNVSVKDIMRLCSYINDMENLGVTLSIGLHKFSLQNIANHIKIAAATHFFGETFISQNRGIKFITDTSVKIASKLPSKLLTNVLQRIL